MKVAWSRSGRFRLAPQYARADMTPNGSHWWLFWLWWIICVER